MELVIEKQMRISYTLISNICGGLQVQPAPATGAGMPAIEVDSSEPRQPFLRVVPFEKIQKLT